MQHDFHIGEWLVQPRLNLVTRGEDVVSIQPKVMDLLVYLAKHPGEVLPKERIITAVWSDTFVSDDSLKYSIFELRKAFQDDPKHPQIVETIPRRGYRLVAAVTGLGLSLEAEPTPGRTLTKYLTGAVTLLVVLVLGLWLRDFLWPPSPPVEATELRIAVLPFQNLSPDPENDYFSRGLAIDIVGQLAKIGDLTVISWTSSTDYRPGETALAEISEGLDATYLLEGSVRREGGQLRVTTQLLDAASNLAIIWSETYDRQFADLFEIQSDIALQVAAALHLKLAPVGKVRIETRPTGNLTAYDFYLRGRDYHDRPTRRNNELSIELFNRALEHDPNFALAHAALAEALLLGTIGFGLPESQRDAAIDVARKAISIDPDLSEGYAALGIVYMVAGRIQEALEAGEQAVQLNPNYDRALRNLGYSYLVTGRFEDAFTLFRKALALAPLHGMNYRALIELHNRLGEYEEALLWGRQALEIAPDDYDTQSRLAWTHNLMGRLSEARAMSQQLLSLHPDTPRQLDLAGSIALWGGEYEEAERHFEKAIQQGGFDSIGHVSLGYILQKTGDRPGAERILSRAAEVLETKYRDGHEGAHLRLWLAMVCSIRGEKVKAYDWLQEAIDSGWRAHDEALKSPLFENLHPELRFQQMMAELKVEVDQIRRRMEALEKEWE